MVFKDNDYISIGFYEKETKKKLDYIFLYVSSVSK